MTAKSTKTTPEKMLLRVIRVAEILAYGESRSVTIIKNNQTKHTVETDESQTTYAQNTDDTF